MKLTKYAAVISLAIYLVTPWQMTKFETVCWLVLLFFNFHELFLLIEGERKKKRRKRRRPVESKEEKKEEDYFLIGFDGDEVYMVEGSMQ